MRRVPVDPELLDASVDEATLDARSAHYVRDVLRLDSGDRVELFDGHGRSALATLDLSDTGVRVSAATITPHPLVRPRLTLFQAPPKGERWEWVLEKATELGVDRIVPIESERSVVRIPEKKIGRKLARWTEIVTAAARQSGRYHMPSVEPPTRLSDAIRNVEGLALMADPGAADRVASALDEDAASIALFVGPEGGWSDDERRAMADAAIRAVRLATPVLRSETAGIFLVGLVRELVAR